MWASAGHVGPYYVEWIAVEFDETAPIAGVILTPRTIGSTVYAYPRDYRIEYSYDENGTYWFPVAGASFENQPTPTGPVTHLFAGEIVARRIRVRATELTTDDYGNYYFQLAEFEPIASDLVPPFATSAGNPFDAHLNMMWLIYGTVSDGTNAVYTLGNEPAFHEWMAIKYSWSQSTSGLRHTLRDGRLLIWPQSNDGYVWSWSDREPWPGVDDPYHNENNAKYILAAWRIWAWERADDWFDLVDQTVVSNPAVPPRPGMSDISLGMTVRQKLRLAMQYLETELQGAAGGITIEDNGMNNTGTVYGDPTNYWDNWKFGYKNAYDNIYYYAALEAMAQLEEQWGNPARADQLRGYRAGCRTQYNSEFWNAGKGRYICTVDEDGVPWDFGSTFVNVEALYYGLGDSAQAAEVFDWLDGRRIIPGETSTGADIYYWKFGPRSNTIAIETIGPPYWWADYDGAIDPATTARWPVHCENGGAIFYVSFYDVMARLQYLGADAALARLQTIVSEFERDQLRRDPTNPGSTNWQLGIIGEFPESGLVPCVMVYGFAGVNPDRQGLHIAPNLPSAWSALTVNGIAWAGRGLDITVTPTDATVTSSVASSGAVYVGGIPISPGETRTILLNDAGKVLLQLAPTFVDPDLDLDGDVDLADFALFSLCFNGEGQPPAGGCTSDADFDDDGSVTLSDFAELMVCFRGSGQPPACN